MRRGCFLLAALIGGPATAADTAAHIDTSGVNLQPAYPVTALKDAERGAVVLRVSVSRNGKVTQVRPLQTSGFDDLDKAGIEGVMGWHFIPATKNGEPTEGDADVAIGFEPPGSTDPTPPKAAGDYLLKTFRIDAARNEYEEQNKAVPCSNGKIESTLEFLHSVGPAESKWKPVATVNLENDKQSVAIHMIEAERFSPPTERFYMTADSGDGRRGDQTYSHMMDFAVPQTVALTWDRTGLVTATVGLESHQFQLSAAPRTVDFVMSGGAAEFMNSWLACFPDQEPAN